MVKLKDTSEYERLDSLLRQLCTQHGFKLYVNGWTRKTYDVYTDQGRGRERTHLARIESLAANNGEIRFFDDRARTFAEELGAALERDFGLTEALLIREAPPL